MDTGHAVPTPPSQAPSSLLGTGFPYNLLFPNFIFLAKVQFNSQLSWKKKLKLGAKLLYII